MTINQRIKVLLVSQNVDEKKIHIKIDMSNRMVKNYIDEDKVPNYIFLKWLFTEIKSLNPQWLFNGEEPMLIEKIKLKRNEVLEKRVLELEKEMNDLRKLVTKQNLQLTEISEDFKGIDLKKMVKIVEGMIEAEKTKKGTKNAS